MIAPAFKYRHYYQRLFWNEKGRRFLSPSGPTKRRPNLCEFFEKNTAASREKRCSKRALAECICPERENARFESGRTLWNSDLHLWFERKNPGPKKPGNGWCAWLFARRIYTVSLIWSEWNYRVSRNYEQQKWYSGSRQSVFLSEISYYAKRNSSLSKLGISFLFDKLNSATAAFKAFPKGWLAVAILLFWQVATKCSFVKILSSILFEI